MTTNLQGDGGDTERRRGVVAGLLSGILVAVIIGLVGTGFALTRPSVWRAEAWVVVLPAPELEMETAAGFYETLSRGQIVSTFAEVIRLPRFHQQAAESLAMTDESLAATEIDVAVVPETAMITLSTSAPDQEAAELLADEILGASLPFIETLSEPYAVEIVSAAAGSGQPSGLSTLQYALAMGAVALVSGLAAQQVVQSLWGIRRGVRGRLPRERGVETNEPGRVSHGFADPPARMAARHDN